jgi:2'-5' RNA ligase
MVSQLNTQVAFWLIPSAEDRAFFQGVIDTLAQEYDAPSFTPHVTIYLGNYGADESIEQLLSQAIKGIQPFCLQVDQLLYSDQYTKTLFVQFHPDLTLSQISETLRNHSNQSSEYELNPHLSLIYQTLSEQIKVDFKNSIHLPKSEVLFDEVSAIFIPGKVQTREDVESWEVICTRKLS